MATPRGAEHRDLEQRLRNIEQTLRELTGAALRRRQLSVTSGDFAVSGGGSVVVQDGGNVRLDGAGGVLEQFAEDGLLLYRLGGLPASWGATTERGSFLLFSKDGTEDRTHFSVTTVLPGALYPDGYASFGFGGDAFNVAAGDGPTIGTGGLVAYSQTETGGHFFDGGPVTCRAYPTTSNAANVQMTTDGTIQRVQSSIRYKQDVADALVDAGAVLDGLRGRTWRDRAEVEADPDTTTRYVGYIAEELHDAGLGEYVLYDDEGRPDGIAYDRLTVPLVAVLREHRDELARAQAERDELREQLAALSARLDTLEAAG